MSVYETPLFKRWIRVSLTGAAIIGTGVFLFKYSVPTDEQLIAALSPELKADYEKNKEFREQEQQVLMENAKITAASNDPIWKTGIISSPFEKDTRGKAPKLVDHELFYKQKAEAYKHEEQEKARQELLERENLIPKKRWWSWR